MALTRLDLQSLADRRLADAKVLIDSGRYDAGYYVAGYSVECGLKACIANLWKVEAFPEKSFVPAVYIHDLKKLIDLAGVRAVFDADTAANAALFGYWVTVLAWTEHSRTRARPPPASCTRPSPTAPTGCYHGSSVTGRAADR